jgi:chromosome segregation protein
LTSVAAPSDGVVEDIVGARVLAGIQMVNISRLSTHPVPITARGLITVAGQGPSDSNGAGKSSFIAGLSLLHADEQWRLQSGAQAAAELLFTAELAGQEAMHANADRGYLIGVFVPPQAATVEELDASVLTVWLRINRQSPHVELRWAHRLHVPFGDTEDERAGGADALWNVLPRSNGRTDIRANRLARTLYGSTVRCVSFLSTSVRASPTANLLAQPLNELTPERIFEAIGALTGLTGEIEQEQKSRAEEYEHAGKAERAAEEYELWDGRMKIVEEGIASRERARTLLAEARDSWRSRCARYLVDGFHESERIAVDIEAKEGRREGLDAQIETAGGEVDRLSDDKAFEESCRTRIKAYEDLNAAQTALEVEQNQNVGSIETLSGQLRRLQSDAAAADGRTVEQAQEEIAEAEKKIQAAERVKGRTEHALREAKAALSAAEKGEDVAVAQVRLLRANDITAAPLVDTISLTEQQRPAWEARLLPYRHAVAVAHHQAQDAVELLAALPGSLLVEADPTDHAPEPDLPAAADSNLPLSRFLAALAERAGADGHIDPVAGVHGIGGLSEALTGRAGRIRAAQDQVKEAADEDKTADEGIREAKRIKSRADVHLRGAKAEAEATSVRAEVTTLRTRNTAIEVELNKLGGPLRQAKTGYEAALGERAARAQQIEAATITLTNLKKELEENRCQWRALRQLRTDLDLPRLHALWTGTVESAEQHLVTLDESESVRSPVEWDELCARLANEVRAACFPPGDPEQNRPEELRVVDEQRADRRSGAYVRMIPDVLRIVGNFLTDHERVDRENAAQIQQERQAKTITLTGAKAALNEAQRTSEALRSTTAKAIKAKLRQVSDEFDRLDQTYGGYGGNLDFPEPEAPADPEKPWQWTITPRWRRGEGKPPSSYRLRGNTAQMDDKAVKLVCAAALAGAQDRPLLLVLDELGRNLGAAHRRDAVALFENIGRDRAISVVGALQDDMERYAIGASSLYIKLRRPSDVMPYNQAPVVIGSEADAARVQLLSDWMTSFRPEPQT